MNTQRSATAARNASSMRAARSLSGDGIGSAKLADPLTTAQANPSVQNPWWHGGRKFPPPLKGDAHGAATVAEPYASLRQVMVVPNRHHHAIRRSEPCRGNGAGKFPGPFTGLRCGHGPAKFAGPLARARGWKIFTPVGASRRGCHRGTTVKNEGGLTVVAVCHHRAAGDDDSGLTVVHNFHHRDAPLATATGVPNRHPRARPRFQGLHGHDSTDHPHIVARSCTDG